ncbi:hypothetical protein M8523_04795 [Hyphomicrobiales bacterium BP6-180914]|uniref:Protein-L-isoaspartate O-methyltransferase n=2 Tax=Lichenifustis flavocetrariae TaxID=2949735 RepID=A0AA41YU34_9HYPH|nr:hypothetical protein [Lichenifustis flavocetrariae]
MEAVPRSQFVFPQHADLANREIDLPTECGQTVPSPLFLARLLIGSRLSLDMRVLLIGLASGYAAALLGQLVRDVVAVDRHRTQVAAAAERFAAFGLNNVETVWSDVLSLPLREPFDRVLILARLDVLPAAIWKQVRTGGAIIHGRAAADGRDGPGTQVLVRVEQQVDGIGKQAVICPSRLPAWRGGVAGTL